MDFIPLSSDPNDIAQLEADKLRYQQRQQLAQSLMGAQYVPNSGGMGVLTSALSSLAGAFMNRRNNESLTDLMRREFDTQNKAAQAKRAQEQADEERKFNQELQKIGYGEKAKRDYATPEFKDGGVFDPTTGTYTPSQAWSQQQLSMEKAKAAISAANRQDPNSGLMAKLGLAKELGATPEQILEMVTGARAATDTQIVGNSIVDKHTGKAVPIVGPDGKPVSISSKGSDEIKAEASNKALAQDALAFAAAVTGKKQEEIAAMPPEKVRELVASNSRLFSGPIMGKVPFTGYDLNAYSNSAAGKQARINNPQGPVSNADFDVAAKSVFSQDKPPEVNADLIYNALKRAQGDAQGVEQAAQVAPTQTAVNPKTGQRIGLVNGQWVPL